MRGIRLRVVPAYARAFDERRWRALTLGLAALTVATLAPLLLWDAAPLLFPPSAHSVLAALPLGLVALAYVVHQGARRVTRSEFARAVLLAASFLFWAANQLWPEHRLATLFNDIAIVGFVLDVFLAIVPGRRVPGAPQPPSRVRESVSPPAE
jgi:hypothetical protein